MTTKVLIMQLWTKKMKCIIIMRRMEANMEEGLMSIANNSRKIIVRLLINNNWVEEGK